MTNDIVILTDIEGTTSSIDFVKNVLFPYSKKRLESFCLENGNKTDVKRSLYSAWEMLSSENSDVAENGFDLHATIVFLKEAISQDRKIKPLKDLQGMIWRSGYENGDYQAHVYQDANRKLQEFHQCKIPLYIYSSGSIGAQKLFFKYSIFGDMLPLFDGHFDTSVGVKKDPQSYVKIAQSLSCSASTIVFLSDSYEELVAASVAGCRVVWVARETDIEFDEEDVLESVFPVVHSFDELSLDFILQYTGVVV